MGAKIGTLLIQLPETNIVLQQSQVTEPAITLVSFNEQFRKAYQVPHGEIKSLSCYRMQSVGCISQ